MKKIFIAFLLSLSSTVANAQLIAVKTNALMDAAMAPNIGLEVALSSNISVAANGFASWNIYGMKAKTYGFTPEFRYWLYGNTFSKLFVGAGATLAHYDFNVSDYNHLGSTWGVGVNVGYNMWLAKHWSVEFHGGVGTYRYHHARNHVNSIPTEPVYNSEGWTVLPYQLGISFVYIIK